jgi:hypothetical protein
MDIEGYEFSLLNNNIFQRIIKINKPPIYLVIHIGASPMFNIRRRFMDFCKDSIIYPKHSLNINFCINCC